MKSTNKKWGTVLVSSRKDNKGQFQMSILREGTGETLKHLFSPVEQSKSLLKAFGLQKGPLLPLLVTGENHRHL